MATATLDEVAEGQLWRSQRQDGGTVVIEELPEGEYLLGEIAMIVPIEIAKVRNIDSGKTSTIPRHWFGAGGDHSYLRIPEADECYVSAEEARAAGIDGWRLRCRRCGTFGARMVRAKDRLILCHNHAAEWKLMLEQHNRDRRAFYG